MTSTLNPAGEHPAEIPEYPMARAAGCPFDPPPALQAMQEEGPLTKVRLWDGSTPWLVTRYAEQRALLADPRISADVTRPGYPSPTRHQGLVAHQLHPDGRSRARPAAADGDRPRSPSSGSRRCARPCSRSWTT